MCIALIGGMDRLQKHYIKEAERFGIELKVFNRSRTDMASKLKGFDALVIFTNKISHYAKEEVICIAKSKNIPVLMYHSCGLCSLRNCFRCPKNGT